MTNERAPAENEARAPNNDRTPRRSRVPAGHILQWVLAAAVVGAIFGLFLPRIVDYSEVWAAIRAMTWLELVTLGALALWNQATYVLVEMAARPGLGWPHALSITQTSTAVANTLPAGAALGAGLQTAMYVSYGFAPRDIATSLAMTGAWNTFAKLAMPVVALALLSLGGNASDGLAGASVVGIAVLVAAVAAFAVALRSERGAFGVGRLLETLFAALARAVRRPFRGGWDVAAADMRRRTIDLLRARWAPLTAATLVSHVTLYLVLLLALRHVGVPNSVVGWPEVLASFSFVRLLSALPVTPGGLGVVELGLTATLVAAGGNEARVVAAILVYRFLTFVLPIPVGALSYVWWRREAERRREAPG